MNDKNLEKPLETTTNNHWKKAFLGLLVASLLVLTVGSSIGLGWWLSKNQDASYSIISSEEDGNTKVTEEEASIASVADKVAPSVVSVVTSSQVTTFFGSTSSEGAGTGIIVSESGYVMTNNHVIEDVSKVLVIDHQGNLFENVKIIGRDPLNDVAFLKITSDNKFTPAVIGDSSTLRVGQQVVAIGNALGRYQNTVTSGILSGTGRPVVASDGRGSSESLSDLLQTDASINSGNSGGPLLNTSGQVIGINTAVASDANGIGFAIPVNSTKGILAEVLATGVATRAYIGVNYIDITPELARQYDLSVNQGAYIYNQSSEAVLKGGPADKAGVKNGDVIQKVNDRTVGKNGGFSSLIGQYRPGEKVTLTILRDGSTITKEVTLDAYSD